MQCIAHVEELVRAGVYAEPDRREKLISRRLPDGIENIEILLDGEVFFAKGGKPQKFGRGAIFWHLGREFDIWRTVKDKHYRCAVFTFRVSRRVAPAASIGTWQDLETLDGFVNEAIELFQHPETDRALLGVWIYGTLLRQFIDIRRPLPTRFPYKLESALQHIQSRFPEQTPLAELSRISNASCVQLNRLFHRHLQCSPAEYILQKRLQHAANLLSSGMSTQQIAGECAFRSTTSFYLAFRRHYHMTPGEYRLRFNVGTALPDDLHFSES